MTELLAKFTQLVVIKVEDADTFLVKECLNRQSDSYKEFLKFSDLLNECFAKKVQCMKNFHNYIAKESEKVVGFYKDKWFRGIVEKRLSYSKNGNALVFFCDFGVSYKLKDNEIFPCDLNFHQSVPYQCKRIKLANLSPISLSYSFEPELKFKMKKYKKYDISAKKFVENLMTFITMSEFECLSVLENGTFSGHLYFEPEEAVCQFLRSLLKDSSIDLSQRINLGEVLVAFEFAVPNDVACSDLPSFSEMGTICRNNIEVQKPYEKIRYVNNDYSVPDETLHNDTTNSKIDLKSVPLVNKQEYSSSSSANNCISYESKNSELPSREDFLKMQDEKTLNGFKSPTIIVTSNNNIENKDYSTYNFKKHSSDVSLLPDDTIHNSKILPSNLIEFEEAVISTGRVPYEKRFTDKLNPFSCVNSNENCINIIEKEDCFATCDTIRSIIHPQEFVDPRVKSSGVQYEENEKRYENSKTITLKSKDNVMGRGLLNYAEKHSNLNFIALGTKVSNIKFSEQSNEEKKLDNFIKGLKELNLCSYCQKNVNEVILRSDCNMISNSPNEDCDEESPCREVIQQKCYGTENDTAHNDSKIREFHSAGSLNLWKTYRVYYSGNIRLNGENLIFDERDMQIHLNTYICKEIIKAVGEKIFITRLQSYLWPLIADGNSCFAVGDKRCGKTIGFVVPFLSHILNNPSKTNGFSKNVVEPSSVIICFGWENVKIVLDLINRLIPPGFLKIIYAWGSVDQNEEDAIKIQLLSGSNILISTFPCFQKLFLKERTPEEESLFHFSLENCTNLVIDDLDQLYYVFSDEVFQLIEKWNQKKNSSKQFIATSSIWFKEAIKILEMLSDLNPNLLISSHMEAVVACQIKTVTYLCKTVQNPIDIVVDLVKKYSKNKIIIITYIESILTLLKQSLAAVSIWSEIIKCSDLMWKVILNINEWKEITSKVLIVCDKPFNPLLQFDVRDVDVLIQLGLPPSKYQFGNRYSLMLDNYPVSLGCKETEGAVCHLILTEEAVVNNGYIIEELERMRASVPVEMNNLKEIIETYEKKKKNSLSLCHYIKAFGECSILNCKWRHYITEDDCSAKLPASGSVSLDIVHVVDASRYLVRLSSYSSSKGEIQLNKYYQHLFATMQEYFTVPSNRIVLKFVQENDFCAVETRFFWARAKVLHVDYSKKLIEITVFLIDEGSTISMTMDSVYKLPEAFHDMPQLITEVYLCNIRPVDQDISWTLNASNYIKDLLLANKSLITYFGKIMMSLKNTLWLSQIVGRKKVHESVVNQRSLKSGLLNLKFGIDYPEHINKLRKMVHERECYSSQEMNEIDEYFWIESYNKGLQSLQTVVGYTLINDISEIGENVKMTEENGAAEATERRKETNGPTERSNLINVVVGEIVSPLHFFVIENDNIERLNELEEKIEEFIKTTQPCEPVADNICIAQFSDKRFYRAKILNVEKNQISAFFLDYGETVFLTNKDLVYPCPDYYMNVLPPQALKCELDHVSIPPHLMEKATKVMVEVIESSDWSLLVNYKKDVDNEVILGVEMFSSENDSTNASLWKILLNENVVLRKYGDNSVDHIKNNEIMEQKITKCVERSVSEYNGDNITDNVSDNATLHNIDSRSKCSSFSKSIENVSMYSFPSLSEKEQSNSLSCSKFLNLTKSSNSILVNDDTPKPNNFTLSEDVKISFKCCEIDSLKTDDQLSRNKMNRAESLSSHRGFLSKLLRKGVKGSISNESLSDVGSEQMGKNGTEEIMIMDKLFTKPSILYGNGYKTTLNESHLKLSDISGEDISENKQTCNRKSVANIRHPITYWKQDEKMIHIKFQLANVQDYNHNVNENSLMFSTVSDDVFYQFKEKLYSLVVPNDSFINIHGSYVVVKLKKLKEENWPRLLYRQERIPWLRSDLLEVSISETSSVKSSELYEKIPTRGVGKNTYGRAAGISDEDEDTFDSLTSCESVSGDEYLH